MRAAATQQPDAMTVLKDLQTMAVEFGFVQPDVGGGRERTEPETPSGFTTLMAAPGFYQEPSAAGSSPANRATHRGVACGY
jgi:hypothetical protein